ncbi:MAG: GNAT family N-acetyltransferase [Gemmatimonadota bacterium]
MARLAVRRTYLVMDDREWLRSSPKPPEASAPVLVKPCPVAVYRDLYDRVGRTYHWRDRHAWSDERLAAHLGRQNVEVWVLRDGGSLTGYIELAGDDEGAVEIAYFGLVPEVQGKGLGGYLLTEGVRRAWSMGARRVWLHTCTLDGPAALPNYLARGFRHWREETYEIEVPG